MGTELRIIRDQKTIKQLSESEVARGRTLEKFNKVLELDHIVKDNKKSLEILNAKLNKNHKKIKQFKIAKEEIPPLILQENSELETLKKICCLTYENTHQQLLYEFNKLANIAEPIFNTELPLFKSLKLNPMLTETKLIEKQSVLTHLLSFSQKLGYELNQTPSIGLKNLLEKIFPNKIFAQVYAKKKMKVLLPGPIFAVIPSYFKEQLIGVPLKLASYGTYFNDKIQQSEIFSLIVITDSQNFQESFESLLRDTQTLISYFFPSILKFDRPAKFLSILASHQIDFAIQLSEIEYKKICTFSNYSTYLSHKARIQLKNKEVPRILSVKIKNYPDSLKAY